MLNTKTKLEFSPKTIIALGIAVLLILLSRVLPLPDGLTRGGLTSVMLLVAAIVLWVTEVLNLAVTSLLFAAMLPFFGLLKPAEVFSNIGGSVFFFVLATFSLTAALSTSTIPTRIAGVILKLSGTNSRKVVIGFVLGTALLSSVMSNTPTCALFASLAIAILKTNGNPKPGTTNLGKALMIGVPAGSVIGGFMTPAGSPTNIMAIGFIEQAGLHVTFLDWMLVGIPLSIICCIIVSICLCLFFKPEPISEAALKNAEEMVLQSGPMSTREKKMLVVIGLMLVAWITSTWLPFLNTTLVALLGMCLFFLPGIKVLTWEQFCENTSWDVLFMIGGVGAIAAAILSSGAATWFVNTVLAGSSSWSPFMVCLIASAVVCCLHIMIPSGPAVAGLATLPMILLGQNSGVNPVYLAMFAAFWGGVTFLLPIDAVPMLTYGYGYYKMQDMMKYGWIPSIIIIFVAALFIPFMMRVLGY